MASAISMPFVFNREEMTDIKKVIGERFYNYPQLTEFHDVEQGVKWDKQILFAHKLGMLAKAITGCTPPSVNGLVMSEKTWTPKDFAFRLTHCSADVNVQNKMLRGFKKMNPDFYNILEGMGMSEIGQFLIGFIEQALMEDVQLKIWWSDTAAATVAGGGVFSNTFDVDYINVIDGLWKQIEASITTGDSNYVPIAANNSAIATALTGTVALTKDSAAVTGTLTTFTTELLVGDAIRVGVQVFTVATIVSDTSLTLSVESTLAVAGATAYTGANYADQALAADEAKVIFTKMFEAADSRLLADPGLIFPVSRTLYDNYLATLEKIQGVGGITQYTEDGKPILKFRGVTVSNMAGIWDNFITTNMNSGANKHAPHRALLTVKANIPIATVNVDDFSTLNAFFAQYENLNVIDGAFNLDTKFLEKYLAVAAY